MRLKAGYANDFIPPIRRYEVQILSFIVVSADLNGVGRTLRAAIAAPSVTHYLRYKAGGSIISSGFTRFPLKLVAKPSMERSLARPVRNFSRIESSSIPPPS